MALTIRDIAELAGVSRGTVDRVLHNRGRVDPAVASRIRKIMEECGYRPSLAAKQLALRHQKNKIGFISKADYNGFWSIVNRNAEQAEKMLAE
ncbi:MAG: LacI family DNA-binding transcriptional regulator, partial [Clostridia bacterium]|nr:LacI family DNA-binding transcriptional regulator [Clostridia bacterium]